MNAAPKLEELLASGALRFSSSVRSLHQEAVWGLESLQGRLVELVGSPGPTALLTASAELVLQAQRVGEPVAWIAPRSAPFHPPDLAERGIDLAALAVVQVETSHAMLRATDQLLRSGAFGLVVVDFLERPVAPLSVQVRLAALCKEHACTLLCLMQEAAFSLASLRARAERGRSETDEASREVTTKSVTEHTNPLAEETFVEDMFRTPASVDSNPDPMLACPNTFTCTLHVEKDKRHGRQWQWQQATRGPLGLR